MMESTAKLTDTNAVLAYLYETYPLCFIAEGETKPLKIGLFQDLAERLTDDSKISKTQLRVALRRYTSSWRYLKSIKAGAQRVDLNGEPCGELSQEHIEHAQATLKESREKAKAKRIAQAKKMADENKKPRSNTRPNTGKTGKPDFKRNKNSRFEKVKSEAKKPAETVNLSPIELSDLKQNQRVNVKLGMTPVKGVVVDINKEDVHVQLDSGLTVKVRSEHILV